MYTQRPMMSRIGRLRSRSFEMTVRSCCFLPESYRSGAHWKKPYGIATFVGLLEFIGEFTRIISFSFRLFGNIFAGEVLLMVISALVPYIIPIPFFGMELFVGFIQAFDEMKQKQPKENNPNINAYVKCIALAVAQEAQGQTSNRDWEVVVFKDETANAFALPGGKIGVHTGILKVADHNRNFKERVRN
jgi:Zn-dependent protease with chaperone function